MNERQQYERHLADKLQNLPPPGAVDESWEQMRILLEKEMPRGGGMPGRRNWWLFGIAIGILFLATWLSGGPFMDSNKTNVASQTLPPAGTTTENNPSATADKGMAQSQSRGEPNATTNPTSDKDEGIVIVIPAENNKDNNKSIDNSEPNADDAKSTLRTNRTADKKADKKNINLAPLGTDRNTTAGNTITGRRTPNNKGRDVTRDLTITTPRDRKKSNNNNTTVGSPTNDGSQQQTGSNTSTPLPAVHMVQATVIQSPFGYHDQPGPVLAPGTIIQKDYAQKSAQLPQPPPAKSAAKKNMQRSREAGVFALGFSLPLAFPLGDQRAMGYNQWAGHNTVSDYLPSPHLQYHLSSKTFLQTEAQLTSPQFVRSTLLYQTKSPVVAGAYTTNSVFAKKLYYFNVPVSIHHSPFPGFYMGTGIQFSSMLSGVALTEERKWMAGGGNGTVTRETYTRFKNDTLSERINGSEFRVLLDANYLFNRFTVGLRYNQALSNYISFQLSPGVPYTFDKNRALQFYLRYNLWEEKKRAAGLGKKALALK